MKIRVDDRQATSNDLNMTNFISLTANLHHFISNNGFKRNFDVQFSENQSSMASIVEILMETC